MLLPSENYHMVYNTVLNEFCNVSLQYISAMLKSSFECKYDTRSAICFTACLHQQYMHIKEAETRNIALNHFLKYVVSSSIHCTLLLQLPCTCNVYAPSLYKTR